MIPISPTLKLIIGSALIGGLAVVQYLGKLEPTWQWTSVAIQVLSGLELYFTQSARKP